MTSTIELAEISKEYADMIIKDPRVESKLNMLLVAELIRYQIEQAMVRT